MLNLLILIKYSSLMLFLQKIQLHNTVSLPVTGYRSWLLESVVIVFFIWLKLK